MKKHLIQFFIPVISLLLIACTSSQSTSNEHAELESMVSDFYTWYLAAIQPESKAVYKPAFVADTNGMTTLDFMGYAENLKAFHFSEALIQREIATYKDCLSYLKEIEYSRFYAEYDELDKLEDIQCDFGNQFRWIGGQDSSPQAVKVLESERLNDTAAVVKIGFMYNQHVQVGGKTIHFQKIGDQWKINQIE